METAMAWLPFGQEIAVAVGGYLVGGINTGYYLVRLRTGGDIREIGSGTAGSSNVSRILGAPGFAVSIAGDAAKGAAFIWVALYLGLESWGVALVMIAVVAGHIWPVHLGLRGGKGLATMLGVALVFDYWLVVVAVALAVAIFVLLRERIISGLVPVAASPAIVAALGHSWLHVVGMAITASLVLYAHRGNIRDAVAKLGDSGE